MVECKYCNQSMRKSAAVMAKDPFAIEGITEPDDTEYPWHPNCLREREDDV